MKRILWLVAAAALALVPISAMSQDGNMPMVSAMKQANIYSLKSSTAQGRVNPSTRTAHGLSPASTTGHVSSGQN
jgi:hypothetical protein